MTIEPKDALRLATMAGIALDPWQLEAFRSDAPMLLINCSRQAGKSTIVALIVVKYLLRADQTIVIIAPSQRQSKELMRKVLNFWRRIGRPVAHEGVSKTSLELVNGSRLEAFPGSPDTIVGFTPDLVILEEAARVEDDTYSAASPMLAVSRGQTIAPSTPKGKRGWWYDLWMLPEAEDPSIQRIKVPATEISRIPPAFLARELRRLGKQVYDEWYMCEFLDDERQAFATADIEATLKDMTTWDYLWEESA